MRQCGAGAGLADAHGRRATSSLRQRALRRGSGRAPRAAHAGRELDGESSPLLGFIESSSVCVCVCVLRVAVGHSCVLSVVLELVACCVLGVGLVPLEYSSFVLLTFRRR